MRKLLIPAAMLLVTSGTAFADGPSIDKCLFCHEPGNEESLMDKGVDYLTAQMKAIRAGDIKHPPVLTGLSDEDIAAMAAELNAGP